MPKNFSRLHLEWFSLPGLDFQADGGRGPERPRRTNTGEHSGSRPHCRHLRLFLPDRWRSAAAPSQLAQMDYLQAPTALAESGSLTRPSGRGADGLGVTRRRGRMGYKGGRRGVTGTGGPIPGPPTRLPSEGDRQAEEKEIG
jgi:hypothetical protein